MLNTTANVKHTNGLHMQQTMQPQAPSSHLSAFFGQATLAHQQKALGAIVVEILQSGKTLNRKAICLRLLARMENATSDDEKQLYQELLGLLF